MKKINFQTLGYSISVIGVATVLIWIGIFKFTPTEAKGIEPLVRNSFLMSWMYSVVSVDGVSKIIGTIEIITAVCLLLHFFWKKAGIVGGIFSALTFLLTLSFLFTTPGVFSTIDGVLITDFFIIKDVMAFGISLMVLGKCLPSSKR
ncbi:MAG: DUF417 family protein [Bacteroidota bacterium]|nr:DUF417 family protein [Bacteroidota bacterium]